MTKDKGRWFLINDIDGSILARNGKFYKKLAHVGDMKFWTTNGWADSAAQSYGLTDYTCKCVYQDETVDVCGKVYDVETGAIR